MTEPLIEPPILPNEYARGRMAYRMGAELDNNPNSPGTLEHTQWVYGWKAQADGRHDKPTGLG